MLLARGHRLHFRVAGDLVAQVQDGGPDDAAIGRARREYDVAWYLADRGAPVLAPAAGPVEADGHVVTLWPFVRQACAGGEDDAALAAGLLRTVHEALVDYPGPLPSYTDALDRCAAALAGATTIGEHCRALLAHQLGRLRSACRSDPAAWRPVHGGAHAGNLLVAPSAARWIDWEEACRGPYALDVAALPREVWPLFPDLDHALVAAFASLRSVTVAIWCLAAAAPTPAMREAGAFHLARVRTLPG